MNRILPGLFIALLSLSASGQQGTRPNILFFTADDMNGDGPGVYGCPIPGITPNIDALAKRGLRFERGHVSIAVCQPCRSVLMTGRYPWRNGAVGFGPIRDDVPTLQESLRKAGYLNGILGKVIHLAPRSKFCWDYVVDQDELGVGRDPKLYGQHVRRFLDRAKKEERPFFLMVNSHDPHRPFAGSEQERRQATRKKNPKHFPPAPRRFDPAEVPVPGFLPDRPKIREELAQYYASVHRCDATLGAVLKELEESGLADRTVVMFISDHGMAFPFAKTNCYPASTHVPWIVAWPGRVAGGRVDREHFISGVDFMPTVLDLAGLPASPGVDGSSFLPLIEGGKQAGRERVFTSFHQTAARRKYPMRSIEEANWCYIYSPWADGKTRFRNESQSGLTFKAMEAAAETDPVVAARVKLFLYRVREELYDLRKDPDARHNLAADPQARPERDRLRRLLLEQMKATEDPLLKDYQAFVEGM